MLLIVKHGVSEGIFTDLKRKQKVFTVKVSRKRCLRRQSDV